MRSLLRFAAMLRSSPRRRASSGVGVGGGVNLTVGFGDGVGLVVGEVVPEVLEVGSLATFDEGFGGGTVEAEVPDAGVIVDWLPAGDAGEEGVHEDEFFYFRGIQGGVGVGNHEPDVVAYDFCLLDSKGFGEVVDSDGGVFHVGAVGGSV